MKDLRSEAKQLTRPSLRSQVPQNNDRLLSFLDRTRLDSSDEIGFIIEGPSLALETETFFPSNLRNGTTGCEIPLKDPERVKVNNSAPTRSQLVHT